MRDCPDFSVNKNGTGYPLGAFSLIYAMPDRPDTKILTGPKQGVISHCFVAVDDIALFADTARTARYCPIYQHGIPLDCNCGVMYSSPPF
jgi:hypothetical protein